MMTRRALKQRKLISRASDIKRYQALFKRGIREPPPNRTAALLARCRSQNRYRKLSFQFAELCHLKKKCHLKFVELRKHKKDEFVKLCNEKKMRRTDEQAAVEP